MKVVEIAFVGYPVTDIERARRFYEGCLGLEVAREFGDGNMAWIEYDIGPGTLAIASGIPQWKPSADGGVAALEVDDFEAAVSHLRANKVVFAHEPMASPVCNMVIVLDPDGNAITIHKRNAG